MSAQTNPVTATASGAAPNISAAPADLTGTFADTMTMVRRQLLHAVRYPMFFYILGVPLVLMLLFVYVFGGTMGRGIGGDTGDYLDYLIPGLLVLTVVGGMQLTAMSVSQDMNEGIIARFKTMPIARGSVLTSHVIGHAVQQLAAVIVIFFLGMALGFRPSADVLDYLGAAGLILVLLFALGWPAVALGVQAKSVEAASNLPMIFMMFPFLGSGFVPTDTMPHWLQVFADAQPFTPIIETLRGLLMGTEIGNDWWISLLWCAGLWVLGYVLARVAYERRSAH